MSALTTTSNIARSDDVYSLLISLHEALDEVTSARVNARLILLLLNHIGDEGVIREAFALARSNTGGGEVLGI